MTHTRIWTSVYWRYLGNKLLDAIVHDASLTTHVTRQHMTHSFDGQHKASISEEDDEDGEQEVAGEHVNDVWLVVEARGQGIVVRSTGALHALWDVPVEKTWTSSD